jgi:hypothetical protein
MRKECHLKKNHAESEKSSEFDIDLISDLFWCVANIIETEEHLEWSITQEENLEERKKLSSLLLELQKVRAVYLRILGEELKIKFKNEIWCSLKHIPASILRSMEVAYKYLRRGNEEKAYLFFDKSKKILEIMFGLGLK